MRVIFGVLLCLIAALPASATSRAVQVTGRATVADAEAQALFREVMSPFCPGLTLADCPSPNAFTLRDEIEARLKKGESGDAILDELVATYGTQILADPSDTPIGSVVWGVPFAFSAVAAVGLAWFLRRATRPHAEEPGLAPAGPPGLQDRLEEELEKID